MPDTCPACAQILPNTADTATFSMSQGREATVSAGDDRWARVERMGSADIDLHIRLGDPDELTIIQGALVDAVIDAVQRAALLVS